MKRFLFLLSGLLFSTILFTQPVIIFTHSSDEYVSESEFSISETKKVHFTKGNLMYQPSTGKWRIAHRQYDIVGGYNSKDEPVGLHGTIWENGVRCRNDNGNHKKSYSGWIDVFAWGTSGWYGDDPGEDPDQTPSWRLTHNDNKKITCNPYEIPNNSDYNFILGTSSTQGFTGDYENADWGIRNNIELGGTKDSIFRTPTKAEFDYLLTKRTDALKLRARGCIRILGNNGNPDTIINGLILLPDNWDPSVIPEKPIKSDYDGNEYYANNEYTNLEWHIMEENGAINKCLFPPKRNRMNGSPEKLYG